MSNRKRWRIDPVKVGDDLLVRFTSSDEHEILDCVCEFVNEQYQVSITKVHSVIYQRANAHDEFVQLPCPYDLGELVDSFHEELQDCALGY